MAAGLPRRQREPWVALAQGLGVDAAPQSGPTAPPHLSREFRAFGAWRATSDPGLWSDEADGLLFQFHLHGFSPLADYAAGTRTPLGDAFWGDLIERWLEHEARPSRPAWHPYPLSLRIVAWAAALSSITSWPDVLKQRVADAILRQAGYLRRVIEDDVGGNHVLKNATALCFAGAVLPGAQFFEAGLNLLRRELRVQLLADGAHEERSPSYHREMLHDLADVAELLRRSGRDVPPWLRGAISQATAWLEALAGPDGRLPLLNDAWEGPPMSSRCEDEITVLGASGLVILRDHRDQLIIDAGALCPPHLPPHAHADALSFVLWLDGHQVVMDPGTLSYTGPARNEFRSTGAHNTVEVDGRDQCVFWGDFRAGLLPRITGPSIRKVGGVTVITASHDGYRRLPDPVIHERTFVWWPGTGLLVADSLRCKSSHRVVSRLCLTPGRGSKRPLRTAALGSAQSVDSEARSWAPWLGQREATRGLVQRGCLGPEAFCGWALLRPGASAILDGDRLRLRNAGGKRAGVLDVGLRT